MLIRVSFALGIVCGGMLHFVEAMEKPEQEYKKPYKKSKWERCYTALQCYVSEKKLEEYNTWKIEKINELNKKKNKNKDIVVQEVLKKSGLKERINSCKARVNDVLDDFLVCCEKNNCNIEKKIRIFYLQLILDVFGYLTEYKYEDAFLYSDLRTFLEILCVNVNDENISAMIMLLTKQRCAVFAEDLHDLILEDVLRTNLEIDLLVQDYQREEQTHEELQKNVDKLFYKDKDVLIQDWVDGDCKK